MQREWHFKKCDTPLDIPGGARLRLRYKQAQYLRQCPEDVDTRVAEYKTQSAPHQGVVR